MYLDDYVVAAFMTLLLYKIIISILIDFTGNIRNTKDR